MWRDLAARPFAVNVARFLLALLLAPLAPTVVCMVGAYLRLSFYSGSLALDVEQLSILANLSRSALSDSYRVVAIAAVGLLFLSLLLERRTLAIHLVAGLWAALFYCVFWLFAIAPGPYRVYMGPLSALLYFGFVGTVTSGLFWLIAARETSEPASAGRPRVTSEKPARRGAQFASQGFGGLHRFVSNRKGWLIAALAVVLGSVLVASRPVTIIEPFDVPESIAARGLTGRVLARGLADRLHLMARETRSELDLYSTSLPENQHPLQTQIPGTAVTAQSIVLYFASMFGIPRRSVHVSGEVVGHGETLQLVVRVGRRGTLRIPTSASDLARALQPSAEHVLQQMEPVILASYLCRQRDRSDDCLGAIEFILETPPEDDDARAYNLAGTVRHEDADLDGAIKRYELAVESDPTASYALYNWGNALSDCGNHAAATEKFAAAVRADAMHARSYLRWGDTLRYLDGQPGVREKGLMERALSKYARAARVDPGYARIYYKWGKALAALARFEEAIAMFERAVVIRPKYARAYHQWSHALYETGEYDAAIERALESIRLDEPRAAHAFVDWGNSHFKQNRYEDAIAAYRWAIANYERMLARVDEVPLLSDDSWESEEGPRLTALREKQEVLTKTLAIPYNNWGRALYALGRNREAVEKLEEAARLHPGFPHPHRNLELTYDALDDPDRAGIHRSIWEGLSSVSELPPVGPGPPSETCHGWNKKDSVIWRRLQEALDSGL